VFYGDPHGEWRPLLAAVQENRRAAVVLLGDCDLDMPLRQKPAPVWGTGSLLAVDLREP
jgi:hypothetical protein